MFFSPQSSLHWIVLCNPHWNRWGAGHCNVDSAAVRFLFFKNQRGEHEKRSLFYRLIYPLFCFVALSFSWLFGKILHLQPGKAGKIQKSVWSTKSKFRLLFPPPPPFAFLSSCVWGQLSRNKPLAAVYVPWITLTSNVTLEWRHTLFFQTDLLPYPFFIYKAWALYAAQPPSPSLRRHTGRPLNKLKGLGMTNTVLLESAIWLVWV